MGLNGSEWDSNGLNGIQWDAGDLIGLDEVRWGLMEWDSIGF